MTEPQRSEQTTMEEQAQWGLPSILELQKLALEKKIHALKDEGNFELLGSCTSCNDSSCMVMM
ncbi:hypothetical protein [Streptomyces chartreusis]|uniref:hypothetical protein n=1 Tax=Streptomyces chartreusis TaxID=1969 RepID=UPI00362EE4AE